MSEHIPLCTLTTLPFSNICTCTTFTVSSHLSHDMTKPTKWLCASEDSESSLCAQWVAEDPMFLHADSEDSDQTGRMPRLIWVFAGLTATFLVLSCRGSFLFRFCFITVIASPFFLYFFCTFFCYHILGFIYLRKQCSCTTRAKKGTLNIIIIVYTPCRKTLYAIPCVVVKWVGSREKGIYVLEEQQKLGKPAHPPCLSRAFAVHAYNKSADVKIKSHLLFSRWVCTKQ